jgi:hypothetical protein
MTRINIVIAAGLALAVTLPAVSAQAQSPRTFVSAAGSDSNPCSFAAPCRHFQAAVNATSAGGEVDALDPAGYGPINIDRAITIEGQGWSYIAPPAGGNGITINAVSGNVAIHGVSLNGAGITGGTNGIVFNAGSSLTVTDCVLQNFVQNGTDVATGDGILIMPASGTVNILIKDTTAVNNGYIGIYYIPTGSAASTMAIDHIVAAGNQFGVALNLGVATGGSMRAAISNSVASANSQSGVYAYTGPTIPLTVTLNNVSVVNNADGIDGLGNTNLLLGHSVITGNNTAIVNFTSPNTFYTYGNNQINLNSIEISGALNTTFHPQ